MGIVLVVQDFDKAYYLIMCQRCLWRMELDDIEIYVLHSEGSIEVRCNQCEEKETYTFGDNGVAAL